MSVPKLKYSSGNSASTTPSGAIGDSDTTFPLTSDTNFSAKSGEGMVIVGEGTANKEYAYATGKSGSSLTVPLANRGLEGTSATGHTTAETVKGILTAGMWNDMVDALKNILDQTTGAFSALLDANGNEVLKGGATSSAVNEVTITNAATGNPPIISATGGDTNIDLSLVGKGTGKVLQGAIYQTPQTYTPADAATATLDLSTGNEHRITMPAGNITIAISNETNGQKFLVSILQDNGGSRTVTWFSTIRWAGGSAPTLTTTGNKRDVFGFIVTGTDTYDGFVVGQNL